MSEDPSVPTNFSGVVRLFPLPSVVLFPKVMMPLHIFEPRYRQMTADALAGDKLIALALLKPGWESEDEGRPALYSMVCLAKLVADQRLDDGRYNILLRGVSRARIVHEVAQDKLYRRAQVELLLEGADPAVDVVRTLRKEVGRFVTVWFAALGVTSEHFTQLLASDMALGSLTDILTFALPLPVEFKQELLEDLDIDRRVRRLLHHLETNDPPKTEDASGRTFPPEFSPN